MKQFILPALLLLTTSAYSQILNVEKFRLDKDTAKVWLGNAGLGLSLKKQQNSVYSLNSSLNAVYLSEKHSYMSLNYIKFVRVESTNVLSEGYAHGRINLFRRKSLSYEPFIQYQYDAGRGLLWRELYGFTFRYRVVAKEKFRMAVNTGAMYEHELWEGEVIRFRDNGAENRAETNFIKSTSNLTLRGDLAKNVTVFFVTYYQARFERFFAPRIISDVQLQFKVNQYIGFNLQFVSTYDALPPIVGNDFVYTLSNNLVITFQ